MLGHLGDLTRGRLLARNVAANLIGWALPAVAALAAIPALVRALGPTRFGVLALAWSLVGYFSLFDLGLGRALTQLLAERAGTPEERDSPRLAWASLVALSVVGLVGGAIMLGAARQLATHWLTVPAELQPETVVALRLLAIAVPCMVVASGLRAVLEAAQQFDVINALRAPLALVNFAGPLAVLPFSRALPAAVGVLVAGRVVLCAVHAWVVWRRFPAMRRPHWPTRESLRALGRIAGWMTVSGVVSPLMSSIDRLVIGLALPVAAVGYYSTAQEVATKLWLFTAALQPVLFPALAATLARDAARAAALFDRAVRITALALLPAAAVLVLFAREGLGLWVGAAFAAQTSHVLQGLAIAVFVNAIGQAGYAALQAGGRSDVAAKLHVVELPLYFALLYVLLTRVGLVGVAIAWGLRMAIDTGLQLWLAGRLFAPLRAGSARALRIVGGAGALLVLCAAVAPLGARVTVAAALLPAIAVVGWLRLLTPDERATCAAVVRRLALRRRGEMPAV